MTSSARSRWFLAPIALVAAAGTTLAALPEDDVTNWSKEIWSHALEGDSARVEVMLGDLPADQLSESTTASFLESMELRATNSQRAHDARTAARAEAVTEMQAHLAAEELSLALRSAVEVQTLSEDFDDAFENGDIRTIIDWARSTIPQVESDRDWLLAQELLFRLRTLYDDTDRSDEYEKYNSQLEEVNQRVALLARYAPRRLHDLRVAAAERAGEEIAEYNETLTEDWRERNAGIDDHMLRVSLATAAREHIEQHGWRPLLEGGLESLRTLATTPSLDESFTGLGDEAKVSEWVDRLDGQLDRLSRIPDADLSSWSLSQMLRELGRANSRSVKLPPEVLFREFGEGAMARLDQFSEVIWPDRLRRFRQATDGNFVGVGILIRHNDRRDIMVVNPLEGSPAYFLGVKPDDVIAEVDGNSTVGWSLNDAVDKITGPKGSEVTLGLKREGVEDLIEIAIERDVIKLHTVMGWWKEDVAADGAPEWNWWIDETSRIAYVRLTQFTDDTYDDLLNAIREMSTPGHPKPAGLILDLRYNPGGLLTSAVSISNLFVSRGVIVSGEDRDGQRAWPDLKAQPHLAALAGVPTVVLINKGSASASEIVSGCLQAYNAAVVVGERTFGKGSVQTVHPITESSLLKLTTQYYRLPHPDGPPNKGRLVHKRPGADVWGVDPDILVTMTPDQIEKSIELRREADLIPSGDDGELDPNSPDRPSIDGLLVDGLDPQLETALLILRARALGTMDEHRASR